MSKYIIFNYWRLYKPLTILDSSTNFCVLTLYRSQGFYDAPKFIFPGYLFQVPGDFGQRCSGNHFKCLFLLCSTPAYLASLTFLRSSISTVIIRIKSICISCPVEVRISICKNRLNRLPSITYLLQIHFDLLLTLIIFPNILKSEK